MRLKIFKINDTVETIDDSIKGVVKNINGDIITLVDELGFEFQFDANQLINITTSKSIENAVGAIDVSSIKKEKEQPKVNRSKTVKPKKRHKPKFEVDLHIHQLTPSTKGMTNFEILNLQLDTARNQLEFAIKKRIPKMVFIHGLGEGVLRQELETLLNRYNNISYYDADFATYGFGATEVRIFQNKEV